ncbi:hypothetical protein HC752_09660 [Vibrio sp. S9_S30]|uniref:hypothetical protein n=1 Tax=Vibrio sp. S9_S30 TaxID=2720226 RepID=UPI001680E10F|nr:hypothetical protein [Vibrio sp. S9_S30]MBD1557207.1 hypothetical protein [Vibrio sp. S9_S30]
MGSRKVDGINYQQGHPEYTKAILAEMERIGENNPKVELTRQKIMDAWKAEKLQYKVVHQKIKADSGVLGSVNVSDFEQGKI